jgi:hypothetical protein
MSLIYETIVTTVHSDDSVHIAPMGIHMADDLMVLAPFRPSATLDNLQRTGQAVINLTDDVRVFAGCLTGRRDWAVRQAEKIHGYVLETALSHKELEIERVEDDNIRPRFYCRAVHQMTHSAFAGFNRAQAAVVEAAILVSRLHMLPAEKIERELEYLTIAMDKTSGPREQEAWSWLMTHIDEFRSR